ncbi:cytochrome c oxidase assembly protein [Nonomuraea helvata]|uniref:Cytochrome c oxidase assembly protein n=1 Tax=Nonomuraea helvata TaxID=37484 RepID=A0ABV5S5K2_9ACTN
MARTYPIERPATVRAFPFRVVPVYAGAAVAAGVVVLLAVLRTVRRTFVRLAAGEMTVMVAAIGLAAGLSRTPPPPGSGGGHGQLALEYALAPFTPGALITEFRLDPTVLLLLALPAAAYVVGARRAGPWPAGRALAWHAGLALAAWALLGGVGSYSRAMLSAQALQHMVLTVVAPLLLSLGAPLTLAARAFRHDRTGPGLLTRPVVLTAVYPVSFLLLYGTSWLPWSLSGYAPRLLTELLFLGIGLLVFRVVAAVDPLPGPVQWAERARLLAVVTAVHLALGAFLLLGPAVAAGWLSLVAPPGAPGLLADQRLAGAVSMLLPLPALALLAVRMAPVLARDGR